MVMMIDSMRAISYSSSFHSNEDIREWQTKSLYNISRSMVVSYHFHRRLRTLLVVRGDSLCTYFTYRNMSTPVYCLLNNDMRDVVDVHCDHELEKVHSVGSVVVLPLYVTVAMIFTMFVEPRNPVCR